MGEFGSSARVVNDRFEPIQWHRISAVLGEDTSCKFGTVSPTGCEAGSGCMRPHEGTIFIVFSVEVELRPSGQNYRDPTDPRRV